jgi:transcriptional regulator NrdR family protein
MSETRQCPNCTKGRLSTRTSKHVGSFIERRRECSACEYWDVVLVRPAEIVVVKTTFAPATFPPTKV